MNKIQIDSGTDIFKKYINNLVYTKSTVFKKYFMCVNLSFWETIHEDTQLLIKKGWVNVIGNWGYYI